MEPSAPGVGMGKMTPCERVDRIMAEAVGRDLSSWERHQFLPSVRQRWVLSDKQERILAEIEGRLFKEES